MRRSTAGAAAAAVGAATAVAALVIGTTTGAAAAGTSSAYGIAVSGLIEPQPLVQSDGTQTNSEELIAIPENPLVSGKVVAVSAGDNEASAETADVSVASQLNASVIEVSCKGANRQTTIVGLEIPGEDFEQSFQPEPNTTIVPEQLGNIAQITLNEQTKTADGFQVNGVVVDLLDGTQKVIVSSATCSGDGGGADDGGMDDGGADDGGADGGADGGDDGGMDDGGPAATEPAPITTGLPVTG